MHIGNDLEQNLLIIAASKNQHNVVENLLLHDYDIDSIDIDGCNAIERAWENYDKYSNDKSKTENIMLNLLRANSKLPRKSYTVNNKATHPKKNQFKYKMAPRKVKNFINMCANLHKLKDSPELEKLEEILTNEPKLIYFYNINNRSLMAHALLNNKIDICKLLVSLKVTIAPHEFDSLDRLYRALQEPQKIQLRMEHRVRAVELPKLHVYTMLMRSKIGRNDRQHDDRWTYVEDAFRIIDADETCSKILKIAAIFKNFTIYFDFKHETVFYLDPISKSKTLAKICGIETIYIGAKNLMDETKKYEVIGAIIHELCHFAVFITYINNFNPYPIGDSKEKEDFEAVVEECIRNKKEDEDIVGSVLEYEEDLQHSEFIVRVVQMLMYYCVQDPDLAEVNTEILISRRQKFGKLFKYFEEVVEKDFDALLEIFQKFLDAKLTFNELTGPFKMRFLHSVINFQGQEITFNDLIENDEEILKLMTPEQIHAMLFKGVHIPIAADTNEYFESSERKFTDYNTDLSRNIKEDIEQDIKNSDEIIGEIRESKIFILADTAGAGKTTSFKNLFLKLKENYKNYWVSLIELRKFQDIFEKYNQTFSKEKTLTIDKVFEMLLEILKFDAQKPSLESKIFEKLFYNDKVIVLLDAVDEISPHFNKFIIYVMQKIQKATRNQILVSTRPQHNKDLSESLKVKSFRLVPFTWKEKKSFILEKIKDSEIYDESKESEVLSDFDIFFKSIKKIGYFNYDIDNPLMVKIITELYIKGQIDLKNQSLDLYEIFEKIEMSHKEQVDSKIEFKDRDPFSRISLESVHQALALLLLSGMNKTELKQIFIIQKWNEDKKELTAEKIQRYGLARIGLDLQTNENFSFDFTHRIYAEFFVAKFILTFFFRVEDYMKDEELEKVIRVIKIFVSIDTIDNIFGFIMCYMKNEVEGRKLVLKDRIKKLIVKEINEIKNALFFDPIDDQLLFLRFFSIFFIREQAILNDFWLMGRERNILEKILVETDILGNSFKLQNIMEILLISFGVNWHEIFNKSDQNLIKDEQIGKIEGNQNFYIQEYNRNLFKFLEYFERNFTTAEKVTICSNEVFIKDKIEFINFDLMKKMLSIISDLSRNNNQILIDILIVFIKQTTDKEILMYLAENLENLLNSDIESMRNVLFHEYQTEQHPIFKAIKLKNFECFEKFKILFDTYKTSDDELKNIFITNNNLLHMILLASRKISAQLLLTVKEIFGADDSNFEKCFKSESDSKVLYLIFEDDKKFKCVEKFVMKFFDNDQVKTKNLFKNALNFGNFSFLAPLMPAIRKRNAVQFEKNLKIYDSYGISWKNVKNLRVIINISCELFLNMTKETYELYKKFLFALFDVYTIKVKNLISKCIYQYKFELLWNEKKFRYFEKFLFEYFKDDEDQARKIIRETLFCKDYSRLYPNNPYVKAIENKSSYDVVRMLHLYQKYKTSDDELREMVKSTKVSIFLN